MCTELGNSRGPFLGEHPNAKSKLEQYLSMADEILLG
jgi:hypothetical protein